MQPRPRQMENNANIALGNLLRGMLGNADVFFESTRVIPGRNGQHPDILITADGRSPVVIEAEYAPASTVQSDARHRLGVPVQGLPRPIEAAIALRYPANLADAYDQPAALRDASLRYCVYTVERYGPPPAREIKKIARFPKSGWLYGSVDALAGLVRLVSVPQLAVDSASDSLEKGIDRAAVILKGLSGVTPAVAGLLGMDNTPQTHRMASAILANAMVFHARISRIHAQIPPLDLVCGPNVQYPKRETLQAWENILNINYWPIFAIGKDLLSQIPALDAKEILGVLEYVVGEINSAGIDNAHDLTGRVFQRLISDRKYLATFYTLPTSAALLSHLAVSKMDGVDWSNANAISRLRIADFACGTGALLSAVYEQIAACHENAGGVAADIHRAMMENVLHGCDVMPSAIHITGSTLAGIQPGRDFGKSRLYTMPYGRQNDNSVKIGSLELLHSSAVVSLFNTSDPAYRTGSLGEETAAQVNVDVSDASFDLVIMNPPFTSNTKHYDADEGVQNAAFAAFNSSQTDQNDMASQLKEKTANTCYHGHAGMASAFVALADKKVKSGGIVAFVLPFTAINGASWAKFRELIANKYKDVTIISISANGKYMSFSSDTGMAECLLIARRITESEAPDSRANFVSITERPANLIAALESAKAILDATNTQHEIRHLEDGPYGGTPIDICERYGIGEVLNAPLGEYERGWGAARISDPTTAQVAYALSQGKLWLPAQPQAVELPIAQLKEIGQLGVHDSMLTMKSHNGPFTKEKPSQNATYPSLYNHNAAKETKLICEPDSQFYVLPGAETKAVELWKTASRTHLNRDFTFGSQALAVAFTERESLGGRVWPNISFNNNKFDYAFALWGNSTLGLLSYWWLSTRQQSSKATVTRLIIPMLPTLDFRALTHDQLAAAETIFNEFRQLDLQPAYLADADPNRALLDQRVIRDLLGLDHATYRAVRRLAAKWCAEPSVHGGKPRPETAEYAE